MQAHVWQGVTYINLTETHIMQAHMCIVLFLKTHMQPHMYMLYYFGDFSAGTQSCMSTLLLKKNKTC